MRHESGNKGHRDRKHRSARCGAREGSSGNRTDAMTSISRRITRLEDRFAPKVRPDFLRHSRQRLRLVVAEEAKRIIEGKRLLQPKQQELSMLLGVKGIAAATWIGYGGARGGGKS